VQVFSGLLSPTDRWLFGRVMHEAMPGRASRVQRSLHARRISWWHLARSPRLSGNAWSPLHSRLLGESAYPSSSSHVLVLESRATAAAAAEACPSVEFDARVIFRAQVHLLRDVLFARTEAFVVGPSGSGKSTVWRALACKRASVARESTSAGRRFLQTPCR
jgi:ABC-type glutathione transport system ATPase component